MIAAKRAILLFRSTITETKEPTVIRIAAKMDNPIQEKSTVRGLSSAPKGSSAAIIQHTMAK